MKFSETLRNAIEDLAMHPEAGLRPSIGICEAVSNVTSSFKEERRAMRYVKSIVTLPASHQYLYEKDLRINAVYDLYTQYRRMRILELAAQLAEQKELEIEIRRTTDFLLKEETHHETR